MLGRSLAEDFLDVGGHVGVVVVARHKDATGILKDGIIAAPQHQEIVRMWHANYNPWLNLGQVVVVVHKNTWLRNIDHWIGPDQLVAVEGVDPGYVICPYTI